MKHLFTITLIILASLEMAARANIHFPLKNSAPLRCDTDTLVRKQSISVGLTGGSDASFFGRTSPKRYRYYTADVIYNTKSGFFGYGTLWKVSGSYPTVDEVDAGAGYLFHISKKISGTASYTHFFFNRNTLIIKSLSTNDFNLKTSYDWKLFKTSVTGDYLFGQANDIFATASISRYYETKFGIFDHKDYLSISPGFSVIFGTQNFVEHYSDSERTDPDPASNYGHDTDDYQTAHANREFNVLNYTFKLPVAYNRAHYTLEATTKFAIPVNVEGQLKNHREFFFNLTFYYLFF